MTVRVDLFRRLLQRISPVDYAKAVATDYATVFKETLTECGRHPLRTLIVSTLLGGAVYAYKTRLGEHDLYDRLTDLRQEMILVPSSIRSAKAVKSLEWYTELYNTNRLDFYDFIFFTLVVQRPYDRKCNIYSTQYSALRDWPWKELWANSIDVGALGRFWLLEKSFVDYDIREEEFTSL